MEKVVAFMFLQKGSPNMIAFIQKALTSFVTLNPAWHGRRLLEYLFTLKNLIAWSPKLTNHKLVYGGESSSVWGISNIYTLFA